MAPRPLIRGSFVEFFGHTPMILSITPVDPSGIDSIAQGLTGFVDEADVAPGRRSTVNESPPPARLGRGLHHETHPPHSRADHLQALAEGFCEAVDR